MQRPTGLPDDHTATPVEAPSPTPTITGTHTPPPTGSSPSGNETAPQSFDVDRLLAIPRLSNLLLSPDGTRLVVAVASVAPGGTRMRSALWELDPEGERPPRQITRSSAGESSAAFLPDGSLLFASRRGDPDAAPDAKDPDDAGRLWRLPAAGGEAFPVATLPAGVEGLATARQSGIAVVATSVMPGATDLAADAERAETRTRAGVSAQLIEGYPIRWWDHWLAPRQRRLVVLDTAGATATPRIATPEPGRGPDEIAFDITPDGRTVVCSWFRDDVPTETATDLYAFDVATGERRVLEADASDHDALRCSPDGRHVVAVRAEHGTPERSGRVLLRLIDLSTGAARTITEALDLWPMEPRWSPDSRAVFFTAHETGQTPVFRVDVGSGAITRLCADGNFTDLCPSPDGSRVYALRSTLSRAPHAIALDARAADQEPRPLASPIDEQPAPARVEEIWVETDDGVRVHAWLVLPSTASAERPAPLAVLIHGGPLSSWAGWSWRWSPQVFAAAGYAALLPDPALSTGYGQAFIDRGWLRWGGRPYTDILSCVDAAIRRPDVDSERTAALGGSFGGYMANWVAGHTDRFRAIVTHASVWALDQFVGTTDVGLAWEREVGRLLPDSPRWKEDSPHHFIDHITTPMLVIHGELDHRVPIGEALRLWTDLRRRGVPSTFLHLPDENHWVLKPQNARVWYRTVLAFLDHHVLGRPWERPDLL